MGDVGGTALGRLDLAVGAVLVFHPTRLPFRASHHDRCGGNLHLPSHHFRRYVLHWHAEAQGRDVGTTFVQRRLTEWEGRSCEGCQ